MDRRDSETSPPILRVAGIGDADRVTALLRDSYPVLWHGVYDQAILDVILPLFCVAQDDLLRSGTFFLVEEAATNAVLGVGGWSARKAGSKDVVTGEGHVRHFAVHAQAQRRGVGRLIMEATLETARQKGVHTLHCTASLTAGAYYRAFGFEETGRITIPVNGIDLSVIEMVWRA